MINQGKHPILGVRIDAVDYEYAVRRIVEAAEERRPLAASALAVHGVMVGFQDGEFARRLNGLDLVVPDGQPVRWALRYLHRQRLADRVYGPTLTLLTAQALAERGLGVYLYGSTAGVIERFEHNLRRRFPSLIVSGREPSKFRRLTAFERTEVIQRILASGARTVFVGLGCPRQEVWAYEYRTELSIPILAVGAAFDFHAGTLSQAPPHFQKLGLEWAFRLWKEPRRLWRRYLFLNPLFLWNIALQASGMRVPKPLFPDGSEKLESYG